MILETTIPPFSEWILPALLGWFVSLCVLLCLIFAVGAFVSVIRHGVNGAVLPLFHSVFRAFEDFILLSPRRTFAIAKLTVKESIRRRVLFVFVVFLVILLFAGWFIAKGQNPEKIYLSIVLSASSILILLLALFLSAFSLPTDIKTKTIYTVCTKPVRASELVMGRIVGISVIGTVILVVMALLSYLFVTLGLQHTHRLSEQEDLQAITVEAGGNAEDPTREVFRGETQQTYDHKHAVSVLADGSLRVSTVNGHTHFIEKKIDGDRTKYVVHNEQGSLQARLSVAGKLRFRGKDGYDTPRGINVGDEWDYRSFIGGSTRSVDASNTEAAIFRFENITEKMFSADQDQFVAGIPVEMTLGVFRTRKGNIEKRIMASLAVRNPKTGLKVEIKTFSTEEFIIKSEVIPWTITGTAQVVQQRWRDGEVGHAVPNDQEMLRYQADASLTSRKTFDLMKDIVADGQFEIWLQCIDDQQYIGVAPNDLYLRAGDASVGLNFIKGFYRIWMQMLLIVCFGVLFSTFLSGPVSMISTVGVLVTGLWKAEFMKIGLNQALGGGPLESLYRLLTQQNMVVDLPIRFATTFIKSFDKVFGYFMQLFGAAIPPLSDYAYYDEALQKGFNIPDYWLLNHSIMTFGYVLPLFIVAYLILSHREVAK